MVSNSSIRNKILLLTTIVFMASLSATAQEIRNSRQKRAFDRIDYLGMNGLEKRRAPFDLVIEAPSNSVPSKRRFDRIDTANFGFNKRGRFDRIDTGHFSNMFRKRRSSSEESTEYY